MTLEMKLQSFIIAGKLRDAPDSLIDQACFEVAYLKAAEPYILLGLSGCYWILFTFILNRLEK